LSRMALDYLTIPATSVDVERLFSKGRMVLPYLRNHLSTQSTHALLCLGQWSKLGLVKDDDLHKVTYGELELDGENDVKLPEGWDKIALHT
ncbi:hypothetical protein SCLCIDRAFT_105925, partial [Scleroderma citrinum Foug A]